MPTAPSAVKIRLNVTRVGDPREVVSDSEARYFGGRVEERSLVPLGEARLGPTEIVKMPGRGHALTIDAGWREVAEKALEFVKRFA